MSLFSQLARVRAARAEVALARVEIGLPAAALFERGKRNPLTTVGAAAGAGFVLGTLNVHPLRVPGVSTLLGGGLSEIMSHGTQLIAQLGAFGLGPLDADGDSAPAQPPAPAPAADGSAAS